MVTCAWCCDALAAHRGSQWVHACGVVILQLHTAAANGYMRVAEMLLTEGRVSVDVVDNEGWQPIHCAAYWRQVCRKETITVRSRCKSKG